MNKEFYLLRHGQTDFNTKNIIAGSQHDVPLNDTGKEQASDVRNIIAGLPIRTICHSPMLRVLQTMHLSTRDHECDRVEIDTLKECHADTWDSLKRMDIDTDPCIDIIPFFAQVKVGLKEALSHPGPSLLICHGGVHRVICHQLQIEDHPWEIDNCDLVHFTEEDGYWDATLV